jgi:ABC-type uncharacterized transport system permease subunit
MIYSLFAFAVPVILSAAGGYITYLTGLLNIAAEGTILLGAFTAFAVLHISGSYLTAVLAAVAVAGLLSYGYAKMTIHFKGNIFISGLAVNLIFPGLIGVISTHLFSTGGVLQFNANQYLPSALFVTVFCAAAVCICLGIWYVLQRTKAGLMIKAAGLSSRALEIRGGNPEHIQVLSFGFSGLLNGLAGAFLTFTLQAFIPNISAGKGWLALAAIYLGGFTFRGTLLAVLFFSAAEVAANAAQGAFNLSASLFLGFPYLVTFLGLITRAVLTTRRKK